MGLLFIKFILWAMDRTLVYAKIISKANKKVAAKKTVKLLEKFDGLAIK